ncbi:IF2 family translation initiation factor [Mycolicibacterium bacteremicum]|uniref:IF2 family translation initiation factor n=1 Tax=Mycolicibacterium bacteremicum TaxID=564198 RepID=UPI0026F16A35|nr:IF2 family translation initiation factor [Mycolicibacterium bacteremicum]
MNLIEVPRTVLRLQYQIVRIPLQLLEDRVMSRLENEAPARLLYERSLGALDAAIGNALGDRRLAHSGVVLAERSAARGRAVQLEAEAQAEQRQADQRLRAARDEAVQEREDARSAKQEAVADAVQEADQRQRSAAADAEKQASAAKKRAADVAAQQRETVRTAERRELDKIKAAEQSVTDDAQAKRDAARSKRADAADKRATADRVEDLADAERQQRRNERSATT